MQSRPITVDPGGGDGFDTPVDDHELTTGGISEMLPGVLPPLLWGVASFLVEEAFRTTLDSLHALPADADDRHRFVRRVRGRAALDLLKDAAAAIPGVSDADIEAQYFGEAAPPRAGTRRVSVVRVLHRDLLAATTRRRARFDGDVIVAATAAIDRAPCVLDTSRCRW